MRWAVAAWVTLIALPADVAADCGPNPPPDVARREAAAVFVGRVASAASRGSWRVYEFDADFAWKGVSGRRVTVLSSEPGRAGCAVRGRADVPGVRPVRARRVGGADCSRTAELAAGVEDLAVLGQPPTVFPAGPITTSVGSLAMAFVLGLAAGGIVVMVGRYAWLCRIRRSTSTQRTQSVTGPGIAAEPPGAPDTGHDSR